MHTVHVTSLVRLVRYYKKISSCTSLPNKSCSLMQKWKILNLWKITVFEVKYFYLSSYNTTFITFLFTREVQHKLQTSRWDKEDRIADEYSLKESIEVISDWHLGRGIIDNLHWRFFMVDMLLVIPFILVKQSSGFWLWFFISNGCLWILKTLLHFFYQRLKVHL